MTPLTGHNDKSADRGTQRHDRGDLTDSRVVRCSPRDEPPEFSASVLLCSPPGAPAAPHRAFAYSQIIAAFTASWTAPGTLAILVADEPTGDHWRGWEWETYWRDRVDVVLEWPVTEWHMVAAAIDRIGGHRAPNWVVLGVPTISTDPETPFNAEEVARRLAIHSPLARVGYTAHECVQLALTLIGGGALRVGGQRHVPLLLWAWPPFRTWLDAQENAGHVLRGGRAEVVHPGGPDHRGLFLVSFRPVLWIPDEAREKPDEAVLIRPPLCVIVAHHDNEIVIVREMRPAAMTTDGCVHEVPGGSDDIDDSDASNLHVLTELAEETGIRVDSARVRRHLSAQPLGSLTGFWVTVYSVELTSEEMDEFRGDRRLHGIHEDTEHTYGEPGWTLRDILTSSGIDHVTRSAVATVLLDR